MYIFPINLWPIPYWVVFGQNQIYSSFEAVQWPREQAEIKDRLHQYIINNGQVNFGTGIERQLVKLR